MFLVAAVLAEAVSAVNRTIVARTERNLGLNAASCTSYVVHFALLVTALATATAEATTVLLFAGCAAIRAATRFVGKAFLSKEILLRSSENEFSAAITARKGFVLSHYV